ncbi:hypothetical protein [Actinotalea sp. C106]|uniref:hypothetical protein n=1 Tax=Actinotalea sp. C106 TaxID=2908644 RepID=UPI0020292EAB|nr:hypothetical protein [Actinotalea sp. C106]
MGIHGEGDDVSTAVKVLQVLRIPALLAVLWFGSEVELQSHMAMQQFEMPELWWWSTAHGAVILAFAVLVLVGRLRRHPLGVLLAELVVAGALGIVPGFVWVSTFGIGSWTIGLIDSDVRTLGIVWLVVVVLQLARWRRAVGTGASHDASPEADGSPEPVDELLDVDTGPVRGRWAP